jgi:transposase
MQKISTLPRSGSRIFKERKLTIGLDLGDRSSWYRVLDEAGEIILEHKLATTPDAMRAMR